MKTIEDYGYIRVGAAIPKVRVADVDFNVKSISDCISEALTQEVRLLVLPELCITGYTCGDLFRQTLLLQSAEKALETIADMTAGKGIAVVAGAPIRHGGNLYNCGVMLCDGRIAGVVPKSYIPGYNEFYETRRFSSGAEISAGITSVCGHNVPFGTDLLFKHRHATIGIEICEDLWVPAPPSSRHALAGANIIANLSASNDTLGKAGYRRSLVSGQSARCRCAYIYASAGYGESTTDLVFGGAAIVAENGHITADAEGFSASGSVVAADIDLEKLENDRRNFTTFADCRDNENAGHEYKCIICDMEGEGPASLLQAPDMHPFVPSDNSRLRKHCEEIIDIQAHGLARRLDITGSKNIVVGISGGLDSTLALLVAVRAFGMLGLDRKGITGITMPGFGTSGRTLANSRKLMSSLGVSSVEIPISRAVSVHFSDIGHNPDIHDVTYENSQARERTQILMDYANKIGGMVLGTGDLSELALGWCTYNGDHMSMYAVNSSVPKTLVRHLVNHFAQIADDTILSETLLDIIDTPISPELIPTDSNGEITQVTEDLVGPYELHDFFIYHALRHDFPPAKIFFLAISAFKGKYDAVTIKKWLVNFYRRFFTQQFKRSCMPDGPKVGSVCLSPRGDWRMPSDASSALWLSEAENIQA